MKNQTQTTLTALPTVGYHRSDCENLIAEVSQRVKNTALEKAESLAEAKQPAPNVDLHTYTSWITAEMNSLKSKILGLLNIEGITSKGASLLARFEKREAELRDVLQESGSKIREQKKELAKINAEGILEEIKRWRVVLPIIVLLLLCEGVSLESAMGALSSKGIIARSVIALAVCIATFFVAKMHVIQARAARSTFSRVLVHLGMFTLAFGIFFALSTMRMSYLERMDTELAERSSTIVFTLVSAVFYLGCVFAKSIYMPSSDDRKQATTYLSKKKALSVIEKEYETTKTELASMPKEREQALYEIYSIIKMAEKYAIQVDHAYESIIGEFLLHNTLRRHDGVVLSLNQYKGGIVPPLHEFTFKTGHL